MKRRRVLAWGMLSTALAVSASIAFWHFYLRRPVGEGPVAIDITRHAFDQPWIQQPVFLVGMGDSITAGFGASPGLGYFDRLVVSPPEDFLDMRDIHLSRVLPKLRTTNLAISGSTSLQLERVQLPRLPRQDDAVLGLVVLTIGGNDLIHNYGQTPPVEGAMYGATWEQAQPWLRNFVSRIDRILMGIQAAFPGGCHIFLANIYDPSDATGNLRWVWMPAWPDGLRLHAAYNDILREAADRHPRVHWVDIYQPFLGHGLFCTQFWQPHYDRRDPHHWYLENVEDPNDRGYDAIRRLFLNAMVQQLAGPSPLPAAIGPR